MKPVIFDPYQYLSSVVWVVQGPGAVYLALAVDVRLAVLYKGNAGSGFVCDAVPLGRAACDVDVHSQPVLLRSIVAAVPAVVRVGIVVGLDEIPCGPAFGVDRGDCVCFQLIHYGILRFAVS